MDKREREREKEKKKKKNNNGKDIRVEVMEEGQVYWGKFGESWI